MHANPAFAIWWEERYAHAISAIRDREEEIRDLIDEEYLFNIDGSHIEHYEIPEDNNEAYVSYTGHPDETEIDWDEAIPLAEGLVSVPVYITCSLGLSFYVYRGEAFDVPDWVNVSLGDFEHDHYFEASAERTGRFTANLILEVTDKAMVELPDLEDTEVSVENVEFDDFVD